MTLGNWKNRLLGGVVAVTSAACAGQSVSDHVAAVHPSGFDASQAFVSLPNFQGGSGQCEIAWTQRCYACTTPALERYAQGFLLGLPGVDLAELIAYAHDALADGEALPDIRIAYEFRPADQPDLEFRDDVRAPICFSRPAP